MDLLLQTLQVLTSNPDVAGATLAIGVFVMTLLKSPAVSSWFKLSRTFFDLVPKAYQSYVPDVVNGVSMLAWGLFTNQITNISNGVSWFVVGFLGVSAAQKWGYENLKKTRVGELLRRVPLVLNFLRRKNL